MDANNAAEFLQAAAATAAVARLGGLKLQRRFPALFAWLIATALLELLLSLFPQRSHTYFWIYVVFLPVVSGFSIAAVRELLALVFRDYPGIRTVGRTAAYGGIALAIALSVGASVVFPREGAHGSRFLLDLEVLQRCVVFTLAVVIVAVLFFLSRYPLHLGRNTVLSATVFSALFLSDALRLLIDSLQTALNSRPADWMESAFTVFCLTAWTVLLQPETAPQPTRINFADPDEVRLLNQLDSLNRLLTRVARS